MRKLLICIGIALLLKACVIPSIHPLYTEDDLIINEDIFGLWREGGNSWDFQSYGERHGDSDMPAETISLVCTSNDEEAEFDLHLIKLGKYYYLDFIASDYDLKNELLDFHLMPFHNFARVEIKKEEIQIEFFNADWFADLLDNNKIRIKHEYMEALDIYVLTASTRSMQKFIEKYGDDPEAYEDPIVLKRS